MATRIESVAVDRRHVSSSQRPQAGRPRCTGRVGRCRDPAHRRGPALEHGNLPRPALGEPAMAALIQEDIGANPEDPHGEGTARSRSTSPTAPPACCTALQVADGFLRAGTIRRRGHRRRRREPRARPGLPTFRMTRWGRRWCAAGTAVMVVMVGFRWMTSSLTDRLGVTLSCGSSTAATSCWSARMRPSRRRPPRTRARLPRTAGRVRVAARRRCSCRRGTVRRRIHRRTCATHRSRARQIRPARDPPAIHTAGLIAAIDDVVSRARQPRQ